MMGDYSTTSYVQDCKNQTDSLIDADLDGGGTAARIFAQQETMIPEKKRSIYQTGKNRKRA